jgi:arylformamidase
MAWRDTLNSFRALVLAYQVARSLASGFFRCYLHVKFLFHKGKFMTLYQGYDLATLEDQYNIEATVESIDVYRTQYSELSKQVTNIGQPLLDAAYGSDPLQKMDIFPAPNGAAPIIVYIHGGYWLRGDKTPYRFPAKVFNAAGATWITLNYRLAEQVKLGDMVSDVRNAIAWIYNNAEDFGSDASRIFVVGSSAGGHLAGMLAADGWAEEYGLPGNVIKGAASMSGLYDLEPFLHTSQKDYLNLSESDALQHSPIKNLPRKDLPMLISWSGKETDEFQRQSKHYAALCKSNGNAVGTIFYPDHNHFSLTQELKSAESSLSKAILSMLEGI